MFTESTRKYDPLPIFDQLPFATFITDANAVLYRNGVCAQLLGLPRNSDIGSLSLSEFESLLDLELRATIHHLLATQQPAEIAPFTFTDPAGSLLTLAISLSVIADHDQWRVLGIIYDVTESSEATARLERHVRELKIIEEISRALHSTMKRDDILRMILAAATCKEGLGFNRAFLFVRSRENNHLIGKLAIGPSSAEEAGHIWAGLGATPHSLFEILQNYLSNVDQYDIEANRRIRAVSADLDREPLFVGVMESCEWLNVSDHEFLATQQSQCLQTLGISRCAIVPLVSRGQAFGVIVADNLITGRPIDDATVRLLQVFAAHASTAIEHAQLFEDLEQKATSLEAAQRMIQRVQKQINAIERSSLLAQLTYKIAHELRNPLTIIGGFAGLIKARLDPADKINEHAQIIIDETLRLEGAMTDVLNFSKSFAEEKSVVDLAEIARGAVDVLAQQRPQRTVVLAPSVHEVGLMVRLNQDQSVQTLYDLLYHLDQALPPEFQLRLRVESEAGMHRVVIQPYSATTDPPVARQMLSDIFTNELQGGPLRIMLAFESIRYNGGEPGIAFKDDAGAYVYVAYPALEEEYV